MSKEPQAIQTVAVTDPRELGKLVPQWEELAREASEDNPFYEHWMLIPALECLGEGEDVQTLFFYEADRLIGLVPLQPQAKYRGVPLPHMRLWMHRHCYLCSPLIRRGRERAVLETLFGWLRKRRFSSLLTWNWAAEDGPVFRELASMAESNGWALRSSSYERAVLKKRPDGEEYLKTALSGKHRRDISRLEKRLSETSELSCDLVTARAELDGWLEKFYELEASGWKGREGTAMKCSSGDQEFMERIVRAAFAAGKARLSLLRTADTDLACKCEFVSNGTCFGFKIGFNESHSKFRPGLLLEIHLLKLMGGSSYEHYDSCSQPGGMFDRIWADRKRICSASLATRQFPEGFVVRSVPHLKRLAQKLSELKSRRPPGSAGATAPDPSAEKEAADSGPA